MPVDEFDLDLEDAVAVDQMASARSRVAQVLASAPQGGPALSVRMNGLATPWFEQDLAMLARSGFSLTSVVVPKVESSADIDRVTSEVSKVPVQALIESPRGVEAASDICRAHGVEVVTIGYADLAAALGRARGVSPCRWIAVQERVSIAARSAGVKAIDGPHLGVVDADDFRTATSWIREMGFDGKSVIHPSQITHVKTEFTSSADEIEDDRRLLRALEAANVEGDGASQLDGRMLDEALAVSARRILSLAGGGHGA